ncbi:hypothetical protein Hte_005942 [Hypoxylon texense]
MKIKAGLNRMPLEDVSSRANQSAGAAGQSNEPQKQASGPPKFSIEDFVEMTGLKGAAKKKAIEQLKAKENELRDHDPAMRELFGTNGAQQADATNGTASTASTSKKRKAEMSLDEEIAAYKRNLDDVIDPSSFNREELPSCQVVRNRINKLLDSGIMNKTQFAEAIGCSDTSTLDNFLAQKGTHGGRGSPVWVKAHIWFRQREAAKLKMPDVKKGRIQEEETAGSTSRGSASKTTSSLPDISNVYLEGEEDDDVWVFDTCDEVRRKIRAHLRTPGVTQAQFCRDLYAQLHAPKIKSIQSKQLTDFLAQKGPRAGAKSTVFYAAYVYFEKLRIAQGKRKSKHREEMEDRWWDRGGFDRTTDHRTVYGPPLLLKSWT